MSLLCNRYSIPIFWSGTNPLLMDANGRRENKAPPLATLSLYKNFKNFSKSFYFKQRREK